MLFVELFHLLFMYMIFLFPLLATSRRWLGWWSVVVVGMNISWYLTGDKCILTQLETRLGDKHARDTLSRRYTCLTIQEKKFLSRGLLLVVYLYVHTKMGRNRFR